MDGLNIPGSCSLSTMYLLYVIEHILYILSIRNTQSMKIENKFLLNGC